MNTSINVTLPLQLTDASGTVGTFLPETKLRELLAERDSLRAQLEEMKRELRAVQAERDQYNRTVLALMRDSVEIGEEAWNALITEIENGGGVDFVQAVREIEQTLGRRAGGNDHAH